MKKISEKTTIQEILEYAGAEEILERYNFPCLHCPMAKYEVAQLQIGEVANTYGLDLKGMLKELNELAKKQ